MRGGVPGKDGADPEPGDVGRLAGVPRGRPGCGRHLTLPPWAPPATPGPRPAHTAGPRDFSEQPSCGEKASQEGVRPVGSEQQRSGSAGLQGGERRKLPVRGPECAVVCLLTSEEPESDGSAGLCQPRPPGSPRWAGELLRGGPGLQGSKEGQGGCTQSLVGCGRGRRGSEAGGPEVVGAPQDAPDPRPPGQRASPPPVSPPESAGPLCNGS